MWLYTQPGPSNLQGNPADKPPPPKTGLIRVKPPEKIRLPQCKIPENKIQYTQNIDRDWERSGQERGASRSK